MEPPVPKVDEVCCVWVRGDLDVSHALYFRAIFITHPVMYKKLLSFQPREICLGSWNVFDCELRDVSFCGMLRILGNVRVISGI